MRTIVTRVAHAGHSEHQFFGQTVLDGLLGVESMTGLSAMSVLGRRPTEQEKLVLDALAASVTVADPRIWPLKAVRLVASYGEMLAGLATGQLVMLGTYMGPRPIAAAAELLSRLSGLLAEGNEPVAKIVGEHVAWASRVGAYGVQLRAQDERLLALTGYMRRTGRADLPHWRAQEALSAVMRTERKLQPNICIGLTAAMLDLGYTPSECVAMGTFLFEHDHVANAIEAAAQRSPEMQQLPADCVSYIGTAPRRSPRAAAERVGRAAFDR